MNIIYCVHCSLYNIILIILYVIASDSCNEALDFKPKVWCLDDDNENLDEDDDFAIDSDGMSNDSSSSINVHSSAKF